MSALTSRRLHWLRHRGDRGWPLVVVSVVIAAGLLAPLLLITLDVGRTGWTEFHRVLFRERSVMLLRNTVVLCTFVAVIAAALGTATAWLTERSAVPARRVWTVLLVLPVAIPDFVVGYAWHSFAPRLNPLLGATIVMSLGTYPLVYLPVAAALRRSDPALEETARGLGLGSSQTFRRVTFPLVRPAVLGGVILVVLTVISEYGAFEILGYQTFTTEIFSEFQFDAAAGRGTLGPSGRARPAGVACRGVGATPNRRDDRAPAALAACPAGADARAGAPGTRRTRCGCRRGTGRNDRVLDAVEPAHDAPGDRERRRGTWIDRELRRVGSRDRGRAGRPAGDVVVPPSQPDAHRARAQHVRDEGTARRGRRA